VRLSDVVEPIVTMASGDPNASGPRIKVAIDPKATASTNPDLLTIILQNLISNAVKYCSCAAAKAHRPAGQEAGARSGVLVQAQPRKAKQGNSWIVSVTDDGAGIPQDRLHSHFKPFERLPQPGENAFADDAGFGLGLAIANQAARLLGTKIQVETQVGRGSTFSLKLPALRK